ncbi:Ig-like domain-containing protein [uncultured Tenacibaculum sp.]|uniref:Ig-like domain-containing protein n=1 Tax=uncultured Tenacibaculum sp. TaxID=174713 RepID=UPI00262B1447|nr:Ig-like domain-containing protein [uncultured Tenacibaculum sp.]
MKKITYLLILCCLISNISYSQTFDLTVASTTDDTPTSVSETLSGIKMTVEAKNSGANNTAIATVGAFGTNQVAFHSSASTNTEEMIISFDTPVNVNTIRVISTQTHSRTWTFTPAGGTNTAVDKTGTFATSTDVTLGFIGVNSITITSNFTGGLQEQIVFDQLTLAVANTDPTISIDSSTLSYTEGETAKQVDASATVSDADGDADWNGGTLVAQITANNEAADELSISDTDGDGTAITISGTNILANGTDVGDLSTSGGTVTNGTALTITFDSDATNAIVQEVLQSLRYRNTSNSPGTANRTITVTATDTNSGTANDTRTVAVLAKSDITSVTVPANATYNTGQNLDFTVNFNENITVNTTGGTPQLAITVGSTVRQATYQSGTTTSALLFRYTIQTGDLDTNGITVGTLDDNNGTLRNSSGTDADLTLNSVGSTTNVLVDAVAPILNSSNPADDDTDVAISQNIVLTFNENISKGTGNILIKKTTDNSTVETIDVTTASVTISTNTATINPTSDLDLNTGYYVQIDNTAFKDAANNNYAGISNSDTTSLNFTTETNQTNSYIPASGNWSVTSNWSLGRLPISTDNVDVNTRTVNLDISNVTVNDLSISIGGAFNILSGQSITINGNLNQNGTLNMLSNASNNGSLIVKGNHTGISNVDYHRYLSTNWHLIAAPIAGKSISDFTGNVNTSGVKYAIAPYVNNVVSASRWNYYTTGAGANNIATAGTFTAGKGYSIQKSTGGTLNFSGTLNTTDKTFPITDGGDNPAGNRWNLVGNPFTASLNASNAANATNNFLKVNIDAGNLDPSRAGLYLWNGTAYVEKSVDDAAFYIAPGQGFFVHAPDAGGTSVIFTEDMQTHQTGDIFLKSNTNYPEIILNIAEGKNTAFTKIRYIENKTSKLDPGSDIGTFSGASSNFKIFTHLINNSEGIDFAIQALPNKNYESMVIPVGIKAIAGKTIKLSAKGSNLPEGIEMFLEDRNNNTYTNLSKEDYTINLKNDTSGIGRFYIHTKSQKTGIENNSIENVSIYKSSSNKITIAGLQTNNATLNVYSILGNKIIQKKFSSSGLSSITIPSLATGVYIFEIDSEKGKTNKKIILE